MVCTMVWYAMVWYALGTALWYGWEVAVMILNGGELACCFYSMVGLHLCTKLKGGTSPPVGILQVALAVVI